MFKPKDKCYKVNKFTNRVETQWKNSKEPKVYIVKEITKDGYIKLYNKCNENVLFDSYGNVIDALPETSSNWLTHKLVKIGDY